MSERTNITGQSDALDVTTCTCANLRKATRVVTQLYDAALQPTGLKATQFSLLATLAMRGDMRLTQLADALVMDRTTLTRNIKPLMEKGLIGVAHEKDQRVRMIILTGDGERIFNDALPLWKQVQSQFVDDLGLDRWSSLLDDLVATVATVQGK